MSVNTAEIIDLECDPETNLLTWGLSTASYVKAIEVVEEIAEGVVVSRAELPATTRSWQVPPLIKPAKLVVRALVLQGGKSVMVLPLPEPPVDVEPPDVQNNEP